LLPDQCAGEVIRVGHQTVGRTVAVCDSVCCLFTRRHTT
jgi:hypothetical protein